MESHVAEALLAPVSRRSLGDAVFEQLLRGIVSGAVPAGSRLPAERVLCDRFGVNRGAVREALKRLAQIRLVAMQQGGATRVLDWRARGGLELLPALLVDGEGRLDTRALRSLLEMRLALGADASRLAAIRGGPACAAALEALVDGMRAQGHDTARLRPLTLAFWTRVIEASENVAYRLAFNSLLASYEPFREVMDPLLGEELRDGTGYAALARAVRRRDAAGAERAARRIVSRGTREVERVLARLERGRAGRRRTS